MLKKSLERLAQLSTCLTSKYVTEDPLVASCRNAYWFRNSVYLNWANLNGQEEHEEAETNIILCAVRGKCFCSF